MRLIGICDEFWMFGVSNGTLEELVYAIKIGKPIKLHLNGFDNNWAKFYKEIGEKYGNPLDNFLNKINCYRDIRQE